MTLRSSIHLLVGTSLAMVASLSCASAQNAPGMSQMDVRPPEATAKLNENLARLGDNPRDINALIGAGEAALSLDDPRAATGFFARADEMQSGNGRIKAGLGRAMLELQNPSEALRLFDQAERLRYPTDSFIGDRALARDLAGDQAGAQRDYQAALRSNPNDAELIKRYAVSLGISGQVDASEKIIQPLLYKNDREAWRNRAFVFAMNGRVQDARNITLKVMPAPLAEAIQPYMERMAGLTPAQRAAAVHFGNFPANTGARVASGATSTRYVTPGPVASASTSATRQGPPAAVVPAPDAGGSAAPSSNPRMAQNQTRPIAPPAAQGVVSPAPSANSATGTSAQITTKVPQARASSDPAIPAFRSAPPPQASNVPITPSTSSATPASAHAQVNVASASPRPVQGPIDPAPVRSAPFGSAASVQPAPQPVQTPPPSPAAQRVATAQPAPNPVATRTLADIMRELNVPDTETRPQVAAVDLTEVMALQERKRAAARAVADKAKRDAAAKAKAEADVKAKALAAEKAKLAKNPSRNWVQIGTGQSTSALGFTWRGLKKKHDTLAAKDAYTAPWGRTNRLVVGPFASFSKAKDFEASLKKAGADVFTWQSEAGEEVVPVAGK